MGHSSAPVACTHTASYRDCRHTSQLQRYMPNDSLNNALGSIRVLGLELLEHELKPHLNTVLSAIQEHKKGAAEQVVVSGILPVLALSLRSRGPLTLPTAKLVAELAKESVVRKGFGEAGLVSALLSVLTSADQELLLHATQAISRAAYDSASQQELLLRQGAVPRLVCVLLRGPGGPLEGACLRALCNLSDMGQAEEGGVLWERGAALRPEERVYRGMSPHARGLPSSVTLVRVARRAAGQYACSVEAFPRCPAPLWSARCPLPPPPRLWLSGLAGRWCRWNPRAPVRAQGLRTRVFHALL